MPRATQNSRSRMLLPVLLILLAVLAWLARGWVSFAPLPGDYVPGPLQTGARPQIYYGPSNSLAVLPFSCSRSDTDIVPEPGLDPGSIVSAEKYPPDPVLAFGVAQTLLDSLVQLPELQITAAASSFFFADSSDALLIVAERLKVSYLLEGCVRRNGQHISLLVRLFDAKANVIQWSEHFESPMAEVIVNLEQIKMLAASAVGTGAGEEHQGGPAPTALAIDSEAWLQFLAGRFFFRQQGLENLEAAELAFTQVLDEEPAYAPAWLGLANIYLDPVWPKSPTEEGVEQARQAAVRALQLEPGLAGAHLVLSRIRKIHDWDWPGAREAAQIALELQPGSADILANASSSEFTFGQFTSAISLLEQSISRNPLLLQQLLRLVLAYEFSGDYDQALITSRHLLGLNNHYPAVHAYRARIKLAQDNPESALRESDQEVSPFWRRYARILALNSLERHSEADELLAEMILENGSDAAFQIAEILAQSGDVEAAFKWLERACEQRDDGLSGVLGNQFFSALEQDPRWQQLLSRLGLGVWRT